MPLPISYSWRNLVARISSTFLTLSGVSLAVMSFVLISAMAAGIKKTAAITGDPENVLVLAKGGATAEASKLPWETVNVVKYLPEVARGPTGESLASVEAILVRSIPRVGAKPGDLSDTRYTTIRGVTQAIFGVHPDAKIVAGRFPQNPGEVLIGRLLPTRLGNVGIGGELHFGRQPHPVVGIFEAGGQIFEGEIWMQIADIMSEMQLKEPSAVVLRLKDAQAANAVIREIGDSKRFSADAKAERKYYEEASRASVAFGVLGNIIGIIMGLGAVFAGMNTMYAAMSRRIREIGTLRALGFGRRDIGTAFLMESLFLSVLGGAVGLGISLAFNGMAFNFFQFAFQIAVDARSLTRGAALALLIGAFGGFLPARAASRLQIVDALRHV